MSEQDEKIIKLQSALKRQTKKMLFIKAQLEESQGTFEDIARNEQAMLNLINNTNNEDVVNEAYRNFFDFVSEEIKK